MKPWDPIIFSVPGGSVPVAPPILVAMPEDDLEKCWWAYLLAHLAGLQTVYRRLRDDGQVYRTGRVYSQSLESVRRLYLGESYDLHRAAVQAAADRCLGWDWHQDPLPLETGWWAQAAYCAHALAAGYAFAAGITDARALLAGDVLRGIRGRVECSLPEAIAADLLALSTSTEWTGADLARASVARAGTSPENETKNERLEA